MPSQWAAFIDEWQKLNAGDSCSGRGSHTCPGSSNKATRSDPHPSLDETADDQHQIPSNGVTGQNSGGISNDGTDSTPQEAHEPWAELSETKEESFPFLRLPKELRLNVYKFCIKPSPCGRFKPNTGRGKHSMKHSQVQSCFFQDCLINGNLLELDSIPLRFGERTIAKRCPIGAQIKAEVLGVILTNIIIVASSRLDIHRIFEAFDLRNIVIPKQPLHEQPKVWANIATLHLHFENQERFLDFFTGLWDRHTRAWSSGDPYWALNPDERALYFQVLPLKKLIIDFPPPNTRPWKRPALEGSEELKGCICHRKVTGWMFGAIGNWIDHIEDIEIRGWVTLAASKWFRGAAKMVRLNDPGLREHQSKDLVEARECGEMANNYEIAARFKHNPPVCKCEMPCTKRNLRQML